MGLLDPPGVTSQTFRKVRRRDLAQKGALPAPMAPGSPLIGAATTTTSLTGTPVLVKPNERGAFLYLHGRATWGGSGFPGSTYFCNETMYTQGTTNPPLVIDFTLDTADPLGRFEVEYYGSGARWRLLQEINGSWQYCTLSRPTGLAAAASGSGSAFTAGSQTWLITAAGLPVESEVSAQVSATLTSGQNGVLTWTASTDPNVTGYNIYRLKASNGLFQLVGTVTGASTVTYTDTGAAPGSQTPPTCGSPTWKTSADSTLHFTLITMGKPGVYRLRLESEVTGRFVGINLASAVDTLRAAKRPSILRVVAGDSFTQPTVQDGSNSAGAYNGLVNGLSYLLGGEWIPAGEGGSGWIINGTGSPASNAQTRITDITKYSPDEVWWTLGLNDRAGSTPAAIQAAATACFQAVAAALPGVRQVAVGPFWGAGWQGFATNILGARDAVKAAAAAVAGVLFLDPLNLPVDNATTTPPVATTLTSAATVGNTQVVAAGSIPLGTYIQIGNIGSSNHEVRRITGVSGTGPYTLQFGGAVPSGGGAGLSQAHSVGEAVTPCGPSYQTGTGNTGAPTNDGNSSRYTGTDGTHPTALGHRNISAVLAHLYGEAIAA